jgi:pyruvate/2-oxoglutarate/acetoin dehydrogenase E1 component
VHLALEAAEVLAREGIETRVVDLRTLVPLDEDMVLETVRATGKVMVLHEANTTGGVGGEIAAFIAERAFQDLDAPVRRLGALDVPVPFAPSLEEAVLPDRARIITALRELHAY